MLLQGDDGYDWICATPMSLIESLIMMVELELCHLVIMKNSGSSSACNPVEHNVDGCTFGTHALNFPRLESTKKVEDGIKQT